VKQTPIEILQQYWGFSSFRGSQEKIINALQNKEDVLALLPTGGGKSVCFQVPALMQAGICIVVSPLIALIQDQVQQLKNKGIKAIALTGGIPFQEVVTLLDNAQHGDYKFLYLSPERLQQELVQEKLQQLPVHLIAIDEAHCISQWGHDFRPAYLKCNLLKTLFPEVPLIALTGTATQQVVQDITKHLLLQESLVVKDSFARKNIAFRVYHEEDKKYRLKQLCTSYRSTLEIAQYLNGIGCNATHFHGGVPKAERKEKLTDWLANKVRIIVATNAFGMGIDKPDVQLVVHYQLPDSLENYMQEAGRAGRDGNPAEAALIYNKNDETQLKTQFVDVLPDVAFVKHVYRKLNAYFQIPYGALSHESFALDFNSFCERYALASKLTHNTLQILDQNSIIALSLGFSQQTSLQFIASKQQLMSYMERHPGTVAILQNILRTYGGVFDYDTKINSALLAKKNQISEQQLLKALLQFHKDEIINYTAKTSDIQLHFLIPREDDKNINPIAKKITKQRELKIAKVKQMIGYIENHTQCRSRQLLTYFEEVDTTFCGKCDICERNKELTLSDTVAVATEVLSLLENKELTSRQLIALLPFSKAIVLDTLQSLLEDEKIEVTTKNRYKLIEK